MKRVIQISCGFLLFAMITAKCTKNSYGKYGKEFYLASPISLEISVAEDRGIGMWEDTEEMPNETVIMDSLDATLSDYHDD